MSSINCVNCRSVFDLKSALLSAEFCWPEMSTIWSICPVCETGNHILVKNNEFGQIKILSQGPDWENINTNSCIDLVVRADPGYMHIWLDNRHYEVRACG